MIRHVPNALTILRLFSVPLTVWLMSSGTMAGAFWLFVAAGVTDAVDGAVARLFNARSRLGMWLDPLADKVLLIAIYITLGMQGHLPAWLVVLVVLRDVLIVLYALVWSYSGSPLFISKVNTAAQLTLAAVVLARLGLGWGDPVLDGTMIAVVAATTLVSGTAYLIAACRTGRNRGESN